MGRTNNGTSDVDLTEYRVAVEAVETAKSRMRVALWKAYSEAGTMHALARALGVSVQAVSARLGQVTFVERKRGAGSWEPPGRGRPLNARNGGRQ